MIFSENLVKGLIQSLPELLTPADFFHALLVSRRESFATLEVDIDRVTGVRRIAPYSDFDEPGPVLEKIGYTTKTVRPPLLKPKKRFTALTVAKRLPGEGVNFGGKSREQALAEILAAETLELDSVVTRTEALQISEELFLNRVNARDEKGEIKFTVLGDRDSALNDTDYISMWNTNPLNVIKEITRRAKKKSGFISDFALLGEAAADSFDSHAEVQKALSKDWSRRGELAYEFAEKYGATFHGIADGREIYSLPDYWFDPKTKAEVAFVPEKKILVGSRRVGVALLYGAIDRADAPLVGPRNITNEIESIDPHAQVIQLHAAPLAQALNQNAFGVGTVLS